MLIQKKMFDAANEEEIEERTIEDHNEDEKEVIRGWKWTAERWSYYR